MLGVFAVGIALLMLDWRGFTTLNGWIKWSRLKTWQKLVVGYFFIGFIPYLVIPYLFQVIGAYRRNKRQEPLRLRQKIAEQEAQLGFLPPVDGNCRVCHKPMQSGAAFCAYCGATAIEHPRVCPQCATVTFSDAQWCPNCRTQLSVKLSS
jgi:RNA polymerase subunit RPABC4/transcription elongation factor Spt4